MALSTIDIENYLRRYSEFKGVFANDQLPFALWEKPFGIVINLDPSWKYGSHWVAVFAPTYGPGLYFDTFGTEPQNSILSFIERNCKNGYKFNHSIYQGDLSIKCGHYCILFLESCFTKINFPLIKCNTKLNEFIINNIY